MEPPRITLRIRSLMLAVVLLPTVTLCAQDNHLANAEQLVELHRLAEAEAALAPILASQPGDAHAAVLLGRVRWEQGRNDEAAQLFTQAMSLNPTAAEPRIWQGKLLASTSQWDESLTMFESVLRRDPADAMAREGEVTTASQAALAARKAREMEASLGLLLRARTFVPDDPVLLRNFGVQAMDMKLYEDSETALTAAHRIRPDDALTLYALSRTQLQMQKMPQAEANMRAYLVMKPDDPTAHYALGRILHIDLRIDEARVELKRSIELQPVQTESYYELGQIELDVHNDSLAAPLFQKVVERDPNHGGALAGLGIIAYRKKDYLTAEGYLKRAAASAPNYRVARYYYGITLMRLGKKEEAAPELEAATLLARQENTTERGGMHLASPPPAP